MMQRIDGCNLKRLFLEDLTIFSLKDNSYYFQMMTIFRQSAIFPLDITYQGRKRTHEPFFCKLDSARKHSLIERTHTTRVNHFFAIHKVILNGRHCGKEVAKIIVLKFLKMWERKNETILQLYIKSET